MLSVSLNKIFPSGTKTNNNSMCDVYVIKIVVKTDALSLCLFVFQKEVFTVDSVYLGDLENIVVAKGPGDSWLLEQIVVKAGQFDNTEWIFSHNE